MSWQHRSTAVCGAVDEAIVDIQTKCLALFVATKPMLFDKQIIVQLKHTHTHMHTDVHTRTIIHKALLLACGNINGVASTHRLLMCREGCQMANTSGWVRLPPALLLPSVPPSVHSVVRLSVCPFVPSFVRSFVQVKSRKYVGYLGACRPGWSLGECALMHS